MTEGQSQPSWTTRHASTGPDQEGREDAEPAEHSALLLLGGIAGGLRDTPTLEGLLRAMIYHLGTRFGLAGALVYRRSGDLLNLLESAGYDEALITPYRAVPLDVPVPLTEVVITQTPVVIPDAAHGIDRFPLLAGTDPRVQGIAAWPLRSTAGCTGALGLSFGRTLRDNAEFRALMEALANLAALFLDDDNTDNVITLRRLPDGDAGDERSLDERVEDLERQVGSLRALLAFIGEITNERFGR